MPVVVATAGVGVDWSGWFAISLSDASVSSIVVSAVFSSPNGYICDKKKHLIHKNTSFFYHTWLWLKIQNFYYFITRTFCSSLYLNYCDYKKNFFGTTAVSAVVPFNFFNFSILKVFMTDFTVTFLLNTAFRTCPYLLYLDTPVAL